MNVYVYIIRSELDNSLYIGQTENLVDRIISHNGGMSKYTAKKRPWILVYTEEYESRTEAIKRERFLKKQRNRAFYNRLIDKWSGSSAG